jgi:hypothetical protein
VINPVPLVTGKYENRRSAHLSDVRKETNGLPVYSGSYPDPARIRVARTAVRAVRIMSPGFFAIHPIDELEPEEDILLLDVSFMSTTPEAMMNVPTYASWLERTDQGEAYAYAAKLLKLLQWIKPASRWILKSPHHLEFPDLIEKHFGDVRFLWPHRRIYESVPSFLSMVTYNHMIFSDDVDERRVAKHWVRKTGFMLKKALDYRSREDRESWFTDIYYKDLVNDSLQTLTRVYSLNGGLAPGLAERFRQHEAEHPHRKHGTHQYSLGDFGITEQDIDIHTSEYRNFISEHYDRSENTEV